MFVLFALFKLTLDEHKTLTKISMRKTSHKASDTKERENPQTANNQKEEKRMFA